MADYVPPNLAYGYAGLQRGHLDETHHRQHDTYMATANVTFQRLAEVPEKDFGDFAEPEKAWAFYLLALWQLLTCSDVAESWARPSSSRRSAFLRAADVRTR